MCLSSAGLLAGLLTLILIFSVPSLRAAEVRPAPLLPTAKTSPPEPSPMSAEGMDLLFPVPAVSTAAMHDSFSDPRGKKRVHHAVDIMAPRNSEIVAVADGRIAKRQWSAAGGNGLYQWSADGQLIYYYAHLQAYAKNLKEGQIVQRGQVLGYVGSTGNAPARAPHLHFAIARATADGKWWGGVALNPYPVWRPSVSSLTSSAQSPQ